MMPMPWIPGHTGTSSSFPFHIAVAEIWKDQRNVSILTRINSIHTQTNFHKIDFEFEKEKQL